jgi:hypothetical protein
MNIVLFIISGIAFAIYKQTDNKVKINGPFAKNEEESAICTYASFVSSIALGVAIPLLAMGVVFSLVNLLH